MKLVKLTVLLLAVVVMTFGACSNPTTSVGTEVFVSGGSYRDITPDELNSLIQDESHLVIINVEDVYVGEIPGTDLFIPSSSFVNDIDELPEDKATPIVLYCLVGQKSADIAALLVESGYSNVYNLRSGMIEWDRQGYPVIQR